MTRVGQLLTALAAAAVALPLAGCGVKSSPQYPEGATHPRQYPAAGPASGPTSGAKSGAKSDRGDEGAKAKDQPTSPQGFPYDYPNRPPTR